MENGRPGRILAIGDIHGCVHALDVLLGALNPCMLDRFVVLGDFIDQGHDTRDVIDRLLELKETCHLICLTGNHEEMLLAALSSPQARRYWENCGGIATLDSYRFGASLDVIPADHLDFIRDCRDYCEMDGFIFVHASFDPDLPMPGQPVQLLRWGLLDEEEARCHFSGNTVVVGHTEQTSGEILDLGCIKCIDTACWRYGWLTALEMNTGELWQASRFGAVRGPDDRPVGPVGQRRP